MTRFSNAFLADIGLLLASAYTHAELDLFFRRAGVSRDSPGGNKIVKAQAWLRLAMDDPTCDEVAVLGSVLEETMDRDVSSYPPVAESVEEHRGKIRRALARCGIGSCGAPRRSLGGYVTGTAATRKVPVAGGR